MGLLETEDVEAGRDRVIEEFAFKGIRRTCETLVASLCVSRDLRFYVLSHSRNGLHSKHYDQHSYLGDKRRVFKKWAQYLELVMTGSRN